MALRGHRRGVLVVEERPQRPPHLLVGHQRRGLVVKQVPVFDAPHPGPDGLLHRVWGVGVDRHVGAPVRRGLHRGSQLVLGVLGDIQRVE